MQDGQVEVLGRQLNGRAGKQLVEVRRNIGFIFQAHNLFGSLTALQNVRMALEMQESDRKRIHDRAVEVLTALGLADRIHYKPSRLSGGQKQRVAIARALANRPQLILADEPTAALDEHSGRDVVNLLKKLAQDDGCTSLIVTHDNRILDVADRIVSMANGHIKSNVLVQEEIEICEFLKQCDVFSHLTTGMLTNIAEEMEQESYPAETVLIRQGDEGDRFYLIKRGVVDVIVNQGQPDEAKVATLGKGQFFGETALLTVRRATRRSSLARTWSYTRWTSHTSVRRSRRASRSARNWRKFCSSASKSGVVGWADEGGPPYNSAGGPPSSAHPTKSFSRARCRSERPVRRCASP